MSLTLKSLVSLVAFCVITSLTVIAQPLAKFSASPLSGCAPLVVHFSDESTGTPTQWKWDLGNATISYLQHPVATYFNPGTYTIKLVVQNAAGKDSLIRLQYITVNASPAPAFSASLVSGCAPLQMQFTNNSTAGSGSITSVLWDFGDGNFSSSLNPSHTYSTPGDYNVSLQVTNSTGCAKTITKTNFVHVAGLVQANFTHSNPVGCTVPETINFQNQSTGNGPLSYSWNFGDGATSNAANPSHTYTTAGIYTVQLVATSAAGCRDTFRIQNLNIARVTAAFTVPATVCAGALVPFSNSSSPTPDSVLWHFGDNSSSTLITPNKIYATAGTYQVKLTNYYRGCVDSSSKPITIVAKPVTAFSGSPRAACAAPLRVNFVSNIPGAISYAWSFGDGGTSTAASPVHTYTAMGSFSVTLISTNAAGCSDTLTQENYVQIEQAQVSINQLPQQGCAPFSWTFGTSITSVDPVVTYAWDFGDGTTSTAANPTHIFAEGLYTIQLITTTAGGCRDTVRSIGGIRASSKPTAAFIATPREVCAFTPVQFTNQSTGEVNNWLWLFGDGGSSTQANPSHAYEDTGFFNVTLIVGNYGCYDTLVMRDYIYVNPPIARFNPVINCDAPFVRSFTDLSLGANEWYWNFGDGNNSTQQNPVHTYSAVGNYTVSLTVKNTLTGCEHTATQIIIIADEQAAFSADLLEVCRRSAVQFSALQNHPGGIVNYEWNFGDGNTGSGQSAVHTYLQAGTYEVSLIITDAAGCKDSLIRPAYIRVNGPAADFSASVPGSCMATSVGFTDLTVTDGIHSVTQWKWNFGDGVMQVFTAPPFSHSYSTAGSYDVTLTVTDASGCIDSVTKNNTLIISAPVASFATMDTASCPGKAISFTNTSTGPSLSYAWNFGDGNTSTEAAPVHIYSRDGSYAISLRITDMYGCTALLSRPNYVRIVTPMAAFSMSDSIGNCPPLIVQFTNQSANQSNISWDFGDGTFSTEANPAHFYNVAGIYFPKLTITGAGGCVVVATKRVVVRGPSGTFSYQDFTGCSPLAVNFRAVTNSRTSFVWDFNDGTTVLSNDSVISHTYTVPGIYVPKMIIKDAAGCSVAVTGPDTIMVSGVAAGFTADKQLLCSNGTVQFTNNTVSNDIITGYAWDFGDGATSTLASPSHFYSVEGLYSVKLKAFTAMGCIDSVTGITPVKVVRTPSIAITQTADGCVPLTKTFTGILNNADTAAISWKWLASNGQSSLLQTINSIQFATAGNYTIQLFATNSSGCKDTAHASFAAYALPLLNAGADISICKGTPGTLMANGAATYTWSPAAGLSCTQCASPAANPLQETNYIVTGTSAQGCVNKESIKVTVQLPFKMQYSRGDTLCVGESVMLSANGANSYAWSPAAGLSSTTSAAVKATPAATTRYMVVGTDAPGCFKDTAYFAVKVFPIPTVEAGPDKTINVGQSITLIPTISSDVTELYWSPTGSIFRNQFPAIDVKPKQTTQYRVEAINPGGCMATDMLTINVLCNGANVFIPNTFSPNADGSNDRFYPRGTGLFRIKSAKIFNRWGELVFESYNMKPNDAMGGWDGTFKGKQLPVDVFVYVMELLCDNDEVLVYKGDVALIR
jgi:gliding motility-associated-like protein